jgi:hypothetical protein
MQAIPLRIIVEKSPIFTLQLGNKFGFQPWTTKSDIKVHPTIETGQIQVVLKVISILWKILKNMVTYNILEEIKITLGPCLISLLPNLENFTVSIVNRRLGGLNMILIIKFITQMDEKLQDDSMKPN